MRLFNKYINQMSGKSRVAKSSKSQKECQISSKSTLERLQQQRKRQERERQHAKVQQQYDEIFKYYLIAVKDLNQAKQLERAQDNKNLIKNLTMIVVKYQKKLQRISEKLLSYSEVQEDFFVKRLAKEKIKDFLLPKIQTQPNHEDIKEHLDQERYKEKRRRNTDMSSQHLNENFQPSMEEHFDSTVPQKNPKVQKQIAQQQKKRRTKIEEKLSNSQRYQKAQKRYYSSPTTPSAVFGHCVRNPVIVKVVLRD